jgi:hypothetical protein
MEKVVYHNITILNQLVMLMESWWVVSGKKGGGKRCRRFKANINQTF